MAAEALLKHGHRVQMVVAPEMVPALPLALVRDHVASRHLDRGYAYVAGGRGADAKRTRPLLRFAVEVDTGVRAALFSWKPTVVVADATPWASELANEMCVPSVICSNFSWDDQYSALYEGDWTVTSTLDALRSHMQRFTAALELPLGPGAPSVQRRHKMPLLSRHPSIAHADFTNGVPLVTWAFGRTPFADQPVEGLERLIVLGRNYGFAIAANSDIASAYPGDLYSAPDSVYWPDILAASRLVISKAGYSTVAETLRGGAHVVPFGITGLPEERLMIRAIEERGLGLGIPFDEPRPIDRMAILVKQLLRYPSRNPVLEDGSDAIVAALLEIAGP